MEAATENIEVETEGICETEGKVDQIIYENQNNYEAKNDYEKPIEEKVIENTIQNQINEENEENGDKKSRKKKERTLAEMENDVKKRWEIIKNCPKDDVDIAEKFYNENSSILYIPTSIECHGLDDIKRVHSYRNHCTISTKDLSSEVIINTTVCGNTVIEEKILTVLHCRPIEWLLPGVQATGRRIVIPIVTIVSFDDNMYIKTKRLYWDQACVLKQVGLIPSISRCPYNGEDTDLPVKGVQQSDPLLTKEQLDDMNSLDILNRHNLKRASIERFKDLRSEYVNKNINDSVKKLFEEKGLGVEESVLSDGRRRSYNTIDFRNKSDTLSGFISGDIKEEYIINEKITNKSFKRDRNESKNINEILSESTLDNASIHASNGSNSSKTRRMFKEHLYQNDNIFSNNCDTTDTSVFSGKRIFADKNKDDVKISMEESDTESECVDSYSTIYDLDSASDKKWDINSLSRQSCSRDETVTESGYSSKSDLINEQMKNLCLKNNFMDDEKSEKSEKPEDFKVTDDLNKNEKTTNPFKTGEKSSSRADKKHRKTKIAPHFISNITFDNYGNLDLDRPKKYRHKKIIVPKYQSSFKIAYDKEELEKDNRRPTNKPISPTFVSHIFDKDDTVRKVRPIHKNSIFYENFSFDDYGTEKSNVKPPLVVKDKYISNIFSSQQQLENPRYINKYSPNIKNKITYSNIRFDGTPDDEAFVPRQSAIMEDHMNKIFAEPSIDGSTHPVVREIPKNNINYTTFRFDDPPEIQEPPSKSNKDKFVSHLFKTGSQESVTPVRTYNSNDLAKRNRNNIYALIHNGSFEVTPQKGIKTQYNKVDNIQGIFNTSSNLHEKVNFRDINTINNIHNSMHQRQPQPQPQPQPQKV